MHPTLADYRSSIDRYEIILMHRYILLTDIFKLNYRETSLQTTSKKTYLVPRNVRYFCQIPGHLLPDRQGLHLVKGMHTFYNHLFHINLKSIAKGLFRATNLKCR